MYWLKTFIQTHRAYVSFASAVVLSFGLMAMSPEDKLTLARAVSSSTIQAGHWMFSWLIDLFNVRSENRMLREQNLRLSLELVKLREERLENFRLRGLLNFKTRVSYPYIPAEVVARDPGRLANTILINVGRREGVEDRMAVVNSDGLVGKVLTASSESSVVQLLQDRNCRVSAVVQRPERAQGIVRCEDGKFYLQDVPLRSAVEVGDVVVSSGVGGIFPEGLLIGTVEEVGQDQTGLFQEVVLKPGVDFSSLEEVFVLQGGRGFVRSVESP
ncbi:rod shape-determining protein MreC [bacterium]|nr:rod shape-determining protein MreC [bacterium]